MTEQQPKQEKDKSFWKGVAFLGALVIGAEVLFDI